jgi:hypothetical protein
MNGYFQSVAVNWDSKVGYGMIETSCTKQAVGER